MKTISIQPGQPGEGMTYNVRKPLPYPYHVDFTTGDVLRQEFWRGEPSRLLGFQDDPNIQTVNLMFRDFAQDPDRAIGKFPVFASNGGMYNTTEPITNVSLNGEEV